MKNMKHLLMFWKIIILFQYNPRLCTSDVNLMSTSPIGEYKLIINQIFRCGPSEKYKIQFNHYVVHTANSTEIKGNCTFLIPFDDTMFLEINLAMRDSSGKWKDNTLVQKSPNACSSMRLGFGQSWNKYTKSIGINDAACPIPPGVYTGDGVDLSMLIKNTNFPQRFFYGTYKLRVSFTLKNEVMGCKYYVYEIRRP